MIPAIHSACNFTLNPAPGDEGKVGSLPVMIHPAGVACFFLPTTQELYALNRGECICISMAMDIRVNPFPPISVGMFADMFQSPCLDLAVGTDPDPAIPPTVNFSLMVTGRRAEASRYLRSIANAIDEGIAIPGISSPDLDSRYMSSDAACPSN
jgi:hypothetical protein